MNIIIPLATMVGVIIAIIQIWQFHSHIITTFEDSFAKEYRELSRLFPACVLLGNDITKEETNDLFDEFFSYFDLSNEQIFLRQIGRIRNETWVFWCDGINSNFRKPAFQRAWKDFENTKTSEFSELRRLLKSNSKEDPKSWKRQRKTHRPFLIKTFEK